MTVCNIYYCSICKKDMEKPLCPLCNNEFCYDCSKIYSDCFICVQDLLKGCRFI